MSQGKRYKFRGSVFQAISGWAAPTVGITAITRANPAVITAAGHGRAVGDVVRLSGILGMVELNGGVFVIQAVTADSMTLKDVDSTLYDAYISGGSHELAQWSGSCEITNYSGASGSTSESESETNCGKAVDFGNTDPGSVTLGYHMAPNSFQLALDQSRKDVAETIIKTTIAGGGGIMYDKGVVTQVQRDGSPSGPWTGGCTLRRTVERIDLPAPV